MSDQTNDTMIPGQSIVPGAAAKSLQEAEVLARHGYQMPEPWFAYGTKMLAMGEAKARELRAQSETLPYLRDGIEAFAERIAAERRVDVRDVKLADLRVNDSGLLQRVVDDKGSRLTLSSHAFSQLATQAPDDITGAARYNVNAWLDRKQASRTLRTRYPNAANKTRDCYAIVSNKYTVLDSQEFLRAAARSLPTDSRVSIMYQDGRSRSPKTGRELPMRTRADVTLTNPFDVPEELGVGRVHELFIRLRTADDGTRGYSIVTGARRVSCINCTILTGHGASFRRRHVGNPDDLRQLIENSLGEAGLAMAEFSGLWREANVQQIHDGYDGTTLSARAVYERLIAAGYVKVPGHDGREAVEALLRAWELEPGDTAAAVNRAITRLAHEGSWRSIEDTEELEEQAGQLLYQRVFALAPLSGEQRDYFDGDDDAELN